MLQHHPALCRRPRRAGHLAAATVEEAVTWRTCGRTTSCRLASSPTHFGGGCVTRLAYMRTCCPSRARTGPAPPVTGDRVPAPGKCTSKRGKARFHDFDKVLDFLGLVDYNKNIKSMSVRYGKNVSIPDEVLCAGLPQATVLLRKLWFSVMLRLVRVCARPPCSWRGDRGSNPGGDAGPAGSHPPLPARPRGPVSDLCRTLRPPPASLRRALPAQVKHTP